MSDARLKTLIRRFVRERLASDGFILEKARMPERPLSGLRQALEFQPGSGHLSGQFTVNVCWTITLADPSNSSFQGYRRIGDLIGGTDTWFSREAERLDQQFAIVKEAILTTALPYLDRYRTIDSIVNGYQDNDLSAHDAFGPDRGWQLFYLGFCYAAVGRTAAAINALETLIEDHSAYPYAWVQERRARATQEICILKGA